MNKSNYEFVNPNTIIFLAGVPLSGKTTLASLIVSAIRGCSLQSMDILRILAQEFEKQKPQAKRNQFVSYGSCDSYRLIGNGLYSDKNLIVGFKAYSLAVTSLLSKIIPKLENQGVKDLLFEGVQLTPDLVAPWLNYKNKLIILTLNKNHMERNGKKIFTKEPELRQRYSSDKLLLLQEEIISQSKVIPNGQVLIVDNNSTIASVLAKIFKFLLKTEVIK